MKVVVVSVGRPKSPLAEAISMYEERAAHYWKIDVRVVDAGAGRRRGSEAVRAAEADRILKQLPQSGLILALTRVGRSMDSVQLAAYLQQQALRSVDSVSFVVGGAFGLSDEVLQRSTRKVSLSPLTLPHDVARLVLAEQLYRAGSILRNEPYHKGTEQ